MKINIVILFFLSTIILNAQSSSERITKKDSIFIFKPSKPLELFGEEKNTINAALGADILFSNSGFGLGFFYHRFLDDKNLLTGSFFVSGLRNTDEWEYWDWNTGQWVVPGKINRLFLLPVTLGYIRFLFADALGGGFKPFATIGLGPSFIFSTPYEKGWFEAWKDVNVLTRFGGYIGIGGYFRTIGSSIANVNIKYYYIPVGGDGIESIKGLPIYNAGGIVLSLSIGYGF